METAVRRVERKTRRSRAGIGAHVCVRRGSSGGKGGRVDRRATLEGDVVVVLGVISINLRRARGFVWIRGRKVNISLVVGMNVTIYDAVRSGVCLVHIGLTGSIGHMRWSHSPAE